MKKLPEDYYLRQRRKCWQREKRSHRSSRGTERNSYNAALASLMGREVCPAPKDVSFYADAVDSTVGFAIAIRRMVCDDKKVLVDFSGTDYLSATAAVYLFSEIAILQANYGDQSVRIDEGGASPFVRRLMRQIGLFELANGTPEPGGDLMPIVCGRRNDYLEEMVDFVIKRAVANRQLDEAEQATAEFLTGRAISEAMLNVHHHAYAEGQDSPWWVTAAIIKDELFIALCDRGFGIPKTLPKTVWWEKAMGLLPINTDGQMIQAAMTYTRSSLGKKGGRGLGTKDMQKLVLEQKRGHFTVVSGRGHYRLSGDTGKEEVNSVELDITGTVIQWRIPLNHN